MIEPLRELVDADNSTIVDLFEARADRSSDNIFLIWGDRSYSYGEARSIIRSVAGALRARFGGGELRVASFLPNCPEAVWAWLGCAYAGGVYIPLNRGHRGALLADLVARAGAQLMVVDREGLTLFGPEAELPPLAVTGELDDNERAGVFSFDVLRRPECYSPARLHPSDLATIVFTSGTTGRAKAVMIPHNQYCRNAARLVEGFGLRSSDVFHNWLPLFHLAGQLHMTMTAIVAGGTVALFAGFSRSAFRRQVIETRATVLCGFAAILNIIWSLPESPDDAELPLRVGIVAGIPDEIREPFEQRFGMKLGDNYGMTEADPITLPAPGPASPGSSGVASADFELAILDEQDQPLPPNRPGEIAVRPRAPGVMTLGYEGDDAATVAAWRNLWFHTGDIGLLDEAGLLHFKGRSSGYIRRRGENISAAEIEAIVATHPCVRECAAVGVPAELGEEEVKLIAAPTSGATLTPADLHAFSAARMAKFMVPRFIELVDALPRTDVGKVRISALRALDAVWDAERQMQP